MQQFKENLKRYFTLSKTISGTTYFLRNLVASSMAFIGGFLVGFGSMTSIFLGLIGILFLIPAILLSIANVYKRINALYPENVLTYTFGLIALQFISGMLEASTFKTILSIVLLVFGCILIFKNSNITEHEG